MLPSIRSLIVDEQEMPTGLYCVHTIDFVSERIVSYYFDTKERWEELAETHDNPLSLACHSAVEDVIVWKRTILH